MSLFFLNISPGFFAFQSIQTLGEFRSNKSVMMQPIVSLFDFSKKEKSERIVTLIDSKSLNKLTFEAL